MSVPGNQAYLYHNKNRIHRTGMSQDKQITPQKKEISLPTNSQLPYKRYDSPIRNEAAEGSITDSSSVSGMALQDHHRGKPPQLMPGKSPKQWFNGIPAESKSPSQIKDNNRPPVWDHLFKAGFYGGNVQQDEQKYSVSSPKFGNCL